MNALEDLLNVDGYTTPINFIDFKEESRKLIDGVAYRKMNVATFTESVPEREQFKENLLEIIETKKASKYADIKQLIHNEHDYLSLYLTLENSIEKGYFFNKLRFYKKDLIKLSLIDIFKTIFSSILYNHEKLFGYIRGLRR